jgi:signal peptidase II
MQPLPQRPGGCLMARRKYTYLTLVAGGVLALDQITKAFVLGRLPLGGGFTVVPGFFDITHVHNPGGAFGFLAALGPQWRGLLFIAVTVVVAALILVLYRQTPEGQRLLATGLALVFGGALGNLVDRVRLGVVVDFLDFYVGDLHWPAFNIADSAITVGVFFFAINALFGKTPGRTAS